MKGFLKSGAVVGAMLVGYTILEDKRNKNIENWEMKDTFKRRLTYLDKYIKELKGKENKTEEALNKIENLETVEVFVEDFMKIKEGICYNSTNSKSTRRMHDLNFDELVGEAIDEIEVRGNEKIISDMFNKINILLDKMRKINLNISF